LEILTRLTADQGRVAVARKLHEQSVIDGLITDGPERALFVTDDEPDERVEDSDQWRLDRTRAGDTVREEPSAVRPISTESGGDNDFNARLRSRGASAINWRGFGEYNRPRTSLGRMRFRVRALPPRAHPTRSSVERAIPWHSTATTPQIGHRAATVRSRRVASASCRQRTTVLHPRRRSRSASPWRIAVH
jgi:hypothetical protein